MKRTDLARPRLLAACALGLIAIVYSADLGTPALLDEPNDAQYAEVAREMVERGDWLSPHLNDVIFLNKPPLLYWLIASAYTLFGIDEAAARLPGLLALLLTLLFLYRLGEELFDGTTALAAAALYAAMPATFLEARFVRPDLLLTAAIVASLLAFVVATRSDGRRQPRAWYALHTALAFGLLAKGMLALLLPAMPIATFILVERRWDLLRALLQSCWLFFVLVTPWHALAAWRHEGFFWDYVVNQHLLFFLDQKEPRDSVPIPLHFFWLAILIRLFPWTWTVPAALVFTLRRLIDDPERRATYLIPLVWAVATLAFFSVTVSRLEHYAIPALPGVALLIGATLCAAPSAAPPWPTVVRSLYAFTAASLASVAFLLPRFLAADDWLKHAPEIVAMPGPLFGTMALAWFVGMFLALRAPVVAILLACAAGIVTTPILRSGMAAFAPVNSSAPVANSIAAVATPDTRIVFEAPMEYQLVAGLNFYLRRPLTLLRPPGFVEPTYLVPYREQLFIAREQLNDLWRQDDVIFVSDPLAPAARSLSAVVPAPYSVIAQIGNRWVVRNR